MIVGLLVSSWFTYLAGLLFTRTQQPLLWGNLLFFADTIAVLTWPGGNRRLKHRPRDETAGLYLPRPKGSNWADWVADYRIRCPGILDDVRLV